MSYHTTKMDCPKCGSEDCNLTTEELGALIVVSIRKRIIHCNHCGYTHVALIVQNKEVCAETRLPGEGDTGLVYMYLGKERG